MRVGDAGPEVQELQLALLARGEQLPRYGADGDFGGETRSALQRFARARGVPWRTTEPVPDALLELLGLDEGDVPECGSDLDLEGVALFDLRDEQVDPHPKGKTGGNGRTVRRSPRAIDSITLHQTDTPFDPPRNWERKYATREEALARRSLRVACHAMAFRAGLLALPVDPLWYISHASALNRSSLGLEVEGRFPGLVGGKTGTGEPETPLTDELVHVARMGVKLLVHVGREAGCPIRYIYAHRQTDSWRRADPGEGLWRRVVLEYAVPVLGLEARPAESFVHYKGKARHGKPVPERWDPDGVGGY